MLGFLFAPATGRRLLFLGMNLARGVLDIS